MLLEEIVTFGESSLDRAAELRTDISELNRLLEDSNSGVLPFWRGKPLVSGCARDSLVWLGQAHELFKHSTERPIFLGIDNGIARFASDVSEWVPDENIDSVGRFADISEQHFSGLPEDHRFSELRSIMTSLTPIDAELVATAKGLINWHQAYKFCSSCGSKSQSSFSGWHRECLSCKKTHFPRTDPVVIMLIIRENSVLMGRSYVWPEGMYSLLAGFVEPGETIEGAVKRETLEEVGVMVSKVEYICSQPWPFPASLMFGCKGSATSNKIQIDKEELEDAKWISREEMVEVFAGRNKSMTPARKGSIAHFLLKQWLEGKIT